MVHGYIYSQPAVEAILLEELAASRPVYVSGSGHAFVCDGNDARGFLHINWGWNGRSNGYYAVSVLAIIGKTKSAILQNEKCNF